jgi:hypothetical protein
MMAQWRLLHNTGVFPVFGRKWDHLNDGAIN